MATTLLPVMAMIMLPRTHVCPAALPACVGERDGRLFNGGNVKEAT